MYLSRDSVAHVHVFSIRKAFPLASSASTLTSQPPVQRIFVADRWLITKPQDMLWISADYQPRCTAVRSNQAAFGYSSGRVLLLELL